MWIYLIRSAQSITSLKQKLKHCLFLGFMVFSITCHSFLIVTQNMLSFIITIWGGVIDRFLWLNIFLYIFFHELRFGHFLELEMCILNAVYYLVLCYFNCIRIFIYIVMKIYTLLTWICLNKKNDLYLV